jgi:hypothetical protein
LRNKKFTYKINQDEVILVCPLSLIKKKSADDGEIEVVDTWTLLHQEEVLNFMFDGFWGKSFGSLCV